MTQVKISNESRVLPEGKYEHQTGEFYYIENPYKSQDLILVLVIEDGGLVNVGTGELYAVDDIDFSAQLNPRNLREQVTITI